jgi:AraC-like DNA-binding protein
MCREFQQLKTGIEFLCYNSTTKPRDFQLHDKYEIFYMVSGACECFIKDCLFSVDTENIVVIPVQCIHKSRSGGREYKVAAIRFTDDFIDDENRCYFNNIFRKYIFTPTDARLAGRIFSEIKSEWETLSGGVNDEISLRLIKYYINELVLCMARDERAVRRKKRQPMHPCVDKIIRFVNENYNKTVTLDDAAAELGFTRGYLSSVFIKNTGIKFRDYLNNIKIKHAKDMLENTQKSIVEIAADCGFNDGNYFSTAFKHAVGISPAKYRRLCAGE